MKTRLTAVLLSVLLLSACDNSETKSAPDPRQQQEIQSVRQLIYPYDRTVTLGGILDNRPDCTDPEWDTLTDDKGRQMVRYRCNYNTSAVKNHINLLLENRYNTLTNQYTQRLDTLNSPEYIKSLTDNKVREAASAKEKAALLQALSVLKEAQPEAKDWQITQELYWSVTGPDPVFMDGGFLVDDRTGQHELKRYLSGYGPVSDRDILTYIYQDKTATAPYMNTVAEGLFRHQTGRI